MPLVDIYAIRDVFTPAQKHKEPSKGPEARLRVIWVA
jgi:hypothetical protein